jgi:hypothetical protein
MTLREKIHEHIDQLDDAVLPSILKELERVKARGRFSQDFWDTLYKVHTRNQALSGEDALKLATEAVKADRQRHQP